MSIKRIFAVAVPLFITSLSAHAGGPFGTVQISKVYVRENRIDIYLTGTHANPMGCQYSNVLLLRPNGYENSKTMAATVLAAHLSGRKISGWTNECGSVGEDRVAIVAGVMIE